MWSCVLRNFSKYALDFMEFRLWIGLWTALFVFLLAAFNLSFLVKFITRFTEDCFATLVAIIFIIDAIKNTLKLKKIKQSPTLATLAAPIESVTTIESLATSTSPGTLISEIVQAATTTAAQSANLVAMTTTVDEDENFAVSLRKEEHEKNFYFSLIIFLMTFIICIGLKAFRNRAYMPSKVSPLEPLR